ncbi:unnamed protein product [Urochloa humidicola]
MESPKPVGTIEGSKILLTKFVDLEKGQEIVDLETQTEEVPIKNQAVTSLITGITSIVMMIMIAVYIVLVFVAFKNMRVGLASACTIILGPFFIFTLMVLKVQRDICIERFAVSTKNKTKGCNLQSGNI